MKGALWLLSGDRTVRREERMLGTGQQVGTMVAPRRDGSLDGQRCGDHEWQEGTGFRML